MSSKRTRRIQTVISPEHHDLLLELTRTHGKMNHIIEQGIEQVYQSKTGIHTCDASKTLNIQEQMIQGGYIFFDRTFIEDFFKGILNDNLIEWLEKFQKTTVEAANPLLTIIDVENSFQGLLEYLQLESDYFKLYNVKFFNENDNTITLQPLLFPQYPELTATVLCRTLDFLNFSYTIEIQNNQILLKSTKEKNNQALQSRNQDLKERFEILWSQVNPIGYYRYKLIENNSSKTKSAKEFTNSIITALDNYSVYNWEPGNIVTKETRSLLVPRQFLNNLLNNDNTKETVIQELTNLFDNDIQLKQTKGKHLKDVLPILSNLWSNLGLGTMQASIEQKGEEQFIVFNKNVLSGKEIVSIINPILENSNYMIHSDDNENEVKNSVHLKLISKTKSILLVDDEPDVIDALKREIKKLYPHANIKTTTNPSTVSKLLEKESFDTIIIDYKMKNMTGVEVLESIKDSHPQIRKILLTGYGDTDIMKEAINRAGINYFINKPWNKEDLKKAIE